MSTDPELSGRPLSVTEFAPRHWLLRRVTCPNPFYLLSAACVIHATGVPLKSSGQALSPEALLSVIGGYAAVLAAIAFVIVRFWKVWDDARSIFMILLLLFLEMALCADGTLQADPGRGTRLLIAGLFAAVAISEFLLLALRLRLPALFRLPYYLQLGILFLYPLALLPSLRANDDVAAAWWIFAFPFLIGLSMLSLWPAMRRGPRTVHKNGTPWDWGWYPWTLFVFLGFCLCLRSYTLCLSFDAATALNAEAAYRLENIFGPYFLVPVFFPVAILLLEAGLQSSSRRLLRAALLLPIVIVASSFPGAGRNAADAQFINRVVDTVGSPVWWSLIAASVFYAAAAWRGVAGARLAAIYAIAALAVVDRGATVNVQTLAPVHPAPLVVSALLTGVCALRSRRSSDWCQALALAAVAASRLGWNDVLPVPSFLVVGHALAVSMLAIGILLDDRTARVMRHLGVVVLMACSALTWSWVSFVDAGNWIMPVYVGVVTTIIAIVVWLRSTNWLKAALCFQLVAVYAGLIVHVSQLLQRTVRWQGLPSFLIALVLLHLGLLTSAIKAGAVQRIAMRFIRGPDNTGATER